MALIICEECGGKVSDQADSCPHCGCPVNAVADSLPASSESLPSAGVMPFQTGRQVFSATPTQLGGQESPPQMDLPRSAGIATPAETPSELPVASTITTAMPQSDQPKWTYIRRSDLQRNELAITNLSHFTVTGMHVEITVFRTNGTTRTFQVNVPDLKPRATHRAGNVFDRDYEAGFLSGIWYIRAKARCDFGDMTLDRWRRREEVGARSIGATFLALEHRLRMVVLAVGSVLMVDTLVFRVAHWKMLSNIVCYPLCAIGVLFCIGLIVCYCVRKCWGWLAATEQDDLEFDG